MPKKSTSLLLCFPTSSSTPSLAGAAGVTSTKQSPRSGSIGSSIFSAVYFFFLLFANVSLLCAGSVFLSWLEMPREDELRLVMASRRAHFIERYLHNSTSSAKVLDQLLGLVQESAQKGIVTNFPDGNLHHNSVWSFGSAFLFLTTIATTVGYGHAAPQTGIGKAFSMIYGTIAIPLLLAFFGELIRKLVGLLNWIFMHSIGRRFRQQSNDGSVSPKQKKGTDVRVKVIFVLFISIVLIFSTILVPAFIFRQLEPRWSYLDALYYCFISMTTVGLGDVIPGEGPEWNLDPNVKELYHISVALYLLMALPLFFLAIKLISSLVSTAEMSFRVPFTGDDDDGANSYEEGTGRTKPRIKVDDASESDSDGDYDNYNVSKGLIGRPRIRADSETQMTSDGEEETGSADDELIRGAGPAAAMTTSPEHHQQTTVIPSSEVAASGSFSYLFPQPGQSNSDVKKSKQSARNN